MQITLYNFKKRTNSCKQPSTGGTDVTCVLKADCSLFNPVFELSRSYADDEINYVKWGTRYYFVSDIVYESNSLCLLKCQEDVLASWRNAIGNSSQYVLRAASESTDTIIDTLYPITTSNTPGLGSYLVDFPTPLDSSGYYVVGFTMGNISSEETTETYAIKRGTVRYLCFTEAQLTKVLWQFTNVNQLLHTRTPFDYINSCVYIPFNLVSLNGGSTVRTQMFRLGAEWDFRIEFTDFDQIRTHNGKITSEPYEDEIEGHTQSATRGEWLCHAPYMDLTLYAGPFGIQTLDTNKMYFNWDSSSNKYIAPFYYRFAIDVITGMGRFEWSQHQAYMDSPSEARDTEIYSSQVGIPIQLSVITGGNIHSFLSATSALSSVFQLGLSSGFVSAAIGSVTEIMGDHIYSKGSNGSLIDVYKPCILKNERTVADDNNSDKGRPLCKVRTIHNLSGFIQCSDADIDFAGTMQEIDAVKNYMNTGFFYE